MNRSGDTLALDDFMGAESIDDLVDFVCDEWAHPAAPQQPVPAERGEAPNCGACPGDGSICPAACRLAEDSPPAERGEQTAQGVATMFDSPQVVAMWQTFGKGHEFRQSVQWAQEGKIPGALFVAFRAGLSAALASAPRVPPIDYEKLIADCYTRTKAAQGTRGCVQFKAGAEWFREQMLAADPQPEGGA
jgi:hypothetical protein